MSVDSLQFCNSLGLIMGKGFKVTSSLETITAPNVIITCTCKAEVRRTQVNDQKEFADIIYGQITSALEDTEFAKGLNRTIVTKDKEIEKLKKDLVELEKYKDYYKMHYCMNHGKEFNK